MKMLFLISYAIGILPILGQTLFPRSLNEIIAIAVLIILTITSFRNFYALFCAGLVLIHELFFYENIYSFVVLLWGLIVASFFSTLPKFQLNIRALYAGLSSSLLISFFSIMVSPDFDAQGRSNGLFSSVLAYGFVVSAIAVLTLCFKFSPLFKIIILSFLIILAIPSGSRHPSLVCVGCITLVAYRMVMPAKLLFFSFVIVICLFLFHSFDFGSIRSLSSNDISDFERVDRIYKYFFESNLQSLLFGHGRVSNGSLPLALGFENDFVIESSALTFAYSYGLFLFVIVGLGFIFSIASIGKKFRFDVPLLTMYLLTAFVSQVFENPTMLLVFLCTTSSILYLSVHENLGLFDLALPRLLNRQTES